MKLFNQTCFFLSGTLCTYFSWQLSKAGAQFGAILFGCIAFGMFWRIPKLKGRNQ